MVHAPARPRQLSQMAGAPLAREQGKRITAVGGHVDVPPIRADGDVVGARHKAAGRAAVHPAPMNAAVHPTRLHEAARRPGRRGVRLVSGRERDQCDDDQRRKRQLRETAETARGEADPPGQTSILARAKRRFQVLRPGLFAESATRAPKQEHRRWVSQLVQTDVRLLARTTAPGVADRIDVEDGALR